MKVYTKGFVIKWEVEIGAITIGLLMNVLAKEVQWSSNQCGRLWFFHKNLGDVRLVNDSHLLCTRLRCVARS